MKELMYLIMNVGVFAACSDHRDNCVKKEEMYIQIRQGLNLWVETFGDSTDEACLFISGAGANCTFWSERLCNELVNMGYFVIRYDHRDCGYSTKVRFDEEPYVTMDMANDSVVIMDTLNVQKAHIIGHSMGGFVAQLLAIHQPERVLSLTSISASTHSPDVPMPPEETWKIFMENNPRDDYDSDLPGFLKVWKYLNGTAEFDADIAVEYTRNLYERQRVEGALGGSHVRAQVNLSDRSEQLQEVSVPAMIVHGEEDLLVDKYGGIQTAACIKNSKLVLIPEMGHMPFNKEVLERFEKSITGFIRSLSHN